MTTTHTHTGLERRVQQLENSLEAVCGILGTMTEMLGRMNEMATHYADTLNSLPSALLSLPAPLTLTASASAGDGGTGHNGPPPPSRPLLCSNGCCTANPPRPRR